MENRQDYTQEDLPDNPERSLKPQPTSNSAVTPSRFRTPQLNDVSILFPEQAGSPAASSGPIDSASPQLFETFRADAMYVLKRVIGKGGFGEVWEALQVSLGRTVAVKRPHEPGHVMDNPTATVEQVFTKEAFTAARLDHPNIIPIYDLGMGPDQRPMLAMKYVEGVPWDDALKHDRTVPLQERISKHLPVLVSVAQAVAFAHSRGVVHRDLKPSQVMVGRFGEVYLMDWGLAVSLNPPYPDEDPIATPVDCAINPAGTVAFMAPEQTEKTCEHIGTWTDVYLLGAILYYILTNTPPHPHSNPRNAFRHAQSEALESPEQRCPGTRMPADLSRLCMRAMERDPRSRIQTASDFVTELNALLSGSGRREESRALAEEAAGCLYTNEDEYVRMEQCDRLLTRALTLDPDNEQAIELRNQLLVEFTESALRHGDLKLAHVQSLRLPDSEQRRALLDRIAKSEGREKAHARQRKGAFVAVCVLIVFLIGHAFVSARIAEKRRLQVSRERMMSSFVMDLFVRPAAAEAQDITRREMLISAQKQLAAKPLSDPEVHNRASKWLRRNLGGISENSMP